MFNKISFWKYGYLLTSWKKSDVLTMWAGSEAMFADLGHFSYAAIQVVLTSFFNFPLLSESWLHVFS